MKKLGTVFLTIYLTLTTLASLFFGYHYFKGKDGSVDKLILESFAEAVNDARMLISGQTTTTRSSRVLKKQNIVYAESNDLNFETLFSSVNETELGAQAIKVCKDGSEILLAMVESCLNEANEFGVIYFSETDISVSSIPEPRHHEWNYKVKKISDTKITIGICGGGAINGTIIDCVVEKNVGDYEYIIKCIELDYVSKTYTVEGCSKLKDSTSVKDFCYMSSQLSGESLKNTLDKNKVEISDLVYGFGIYMSNVASANTGKDATQQVVVDIINNSKDTIGDYSSYSTDKDKVENNSFEKYLEIVNSVAF